MWKLRKPSENRSLIDIEYCFYTVAWSQWATSVMKQVTKKISAGQLAQNTE